MAGSFDFFVTNIEMDGNFLKLWGHKDKNSAQNVERIIQQKFQDFEKGIGVPDPHALVPDLLCCARYNDGGYYRARITHVDWSAGMVLCFFIDYGNRERVAICDLRTVDPYDALLKLAPQASCYLLSRVVGSWDPPALNFIKSAIMYSELKGVQVQSVGQINLLNLYVEGGQDFGEYLMRLGLASLVPAENFEVMVWRSLAVAVPQGLGCLGLGALPTATAPAYPFPLGPVGPVLQRPVLPLPSVIPPQPPAVSSIPHRLPAVDMKESTASRFPTYPTLQPNTEHTAFVSYCDKSSSTIYCQLSKDQPQLEALSAALNDPAVTKLVQLTPPYIPGRICVAKYTEDDQLYRGVITGVTDKVNVYFVDYGNSDTVPPSDVFEIPSDYSHHQVMALPFALASWNQADVSDEMFEILSDLINEHNVVLKVAASQDLSTKQLCDLFIDETNVTQLVNTELLRRKPKLTFRNIHFPTPGGKVEVVVAYVKSLNNFYVQLAAHQKDLEDKMAEVDSYCNGPAALMKAEDIVPGAPCCALFPADGQWYRAMILNASIEDLTVMYVDYGNEEKVTIADLRAANESIVNPLRAQAIPCRLTGFDVKADHQLVQRFEELVLEKTFTLHVLDLNEDVPCLWVKLLDENGTDITTSLKAPMHQINGHAIAPPASVKVAISGPGEREVVLSKESYRSRETTAKPVNHYQDRDRTRNARPIDQDLSTQCPKKDPAAWGIGEKRREKHSAIGHCDRDNGAYETESQASRKWNDAPQHPSIKYSTIATGDIKPVVIVFSNGPTDFNVQLRPTDSKFEMLSEQIEKLFSTGGSTLGRSLVVVGTACVARYKEDESFYRAEIKEVRKDGALVHFVDYGNNEVVNFEDLKEIPDEFLALPAQAFHCSLKGVSECTQDSLIKKFNDLLDYQSLEAEILDFRDHLYHVILRDSNDSLTINEQYGAALTDLLSPSSIVFSLPQLSISEGDSADVTVTWFKSPDNFYIMQKSFEAEFKKMMTALQEDYKSKEPVATPSIGHVVVARYTDGAFYRAEIVVKKDSKFGVQFLDYGNRCLVAPSCIFGLELQHAALPPLAIQCQLFGVKPIGNSWSNSSDILNLFHGNLKCSFKERSSKGFIVSCNSNGQDVADQLIVDKLAKSSLQEDHQTIPHIKGKKREMPVGSSHQAIFAYLEEPDKFFVHLESESSDLESLQSELQAAAEMMPPLEGPAIPGSLIMAIFEDAWYRGLVTATNKVFFLDYGNTEDYPSDSASVRKLPKHLESWPGFAIQCRFDRPASKVWSQNASEELVRIFDQEEKLQLKIISKSLDEDSFVVNLDGISEGLHDLWSDTVGVDDTNQDSVPIPVHVEKREMPVGSSHQAIFAYLEEPDKFFVHLESESSDLESLQSELQAAAEMMPPLEGPAIPGSLIMAIFEDAWYRGLVTATNKVFFLDYGNTEDYPSDSASVRKLPKHLESWPGFAIQCRFDRPASKVWSQNASEELVRIFDQEEKLQLKIISKSLDEDALVIYLDGISERLPDLWSDAVSANDTIEDSVPVPIHMKKREMAVGSSHEATFAFFDEPDVFYVNLQSEASDLENVQKQLQLASGNMPPLEGPATPGSLIMAIFEDAWYRALVTATNKVFFLDYGNTEDYPSDSASVRNLPKHLEIFPGFAIRCRFDRPASKAWSPNASEALVRIFDQKEKLQLTIISKSLDEDSFVVNLDGISEKLPLLWSDIPVDVDVIAKEEDCLMDGVGVGCNIVYLTSPDEFYVHLDSDAEKLEHIAQELLQADGFDTSQDWCEGDTCAALFDEDGVWYRAMVVSATPPSYKVRFVDYGNESESHALRKLPEKLLELPPLAYHCALPKPKDISWSCDTAKSKLETLVDSCDCKFTIELLTKEEPYLVSLYGNGVNLNLDIAVCCGYDPEIIRAHLSTLQVSRGKTIKLTTHLDDIETQVDEHQDLDLNVTPHLHPNGSVVNECVDSQGKGEQSAAADVAQIVEIGIPDVVLLRSHCDNEVKSGESLMACESGNGLGSVSDAFTEEAETLENLSANDKIIGNAEELAPSDSAVSLILNLSEHLAESVEIGSEEYPPRDIRDEEVKFEESLTVCEVDDGTGALSGAYIKEAETLDKLSINNECASSILVESLMSDFSERLEASKEADATEFGLAEECPQSDTCDNEAKSEEFCEVFGVMRASSESCSDHAGTLDKLPTIDEVVEKSEPAPSLSILSEHVAVSEEAEAVEMRSSEECVSRNLSGNGADNHFVNDVIDKSDLCLLGDSDEVKSDVSSTVNNSEEPCISDEVEILFEALKVSSLDDSVVEITETQIPVITIDDSDVDDNNCLPTNTPDEMPDLINSVNSLSVSNSGDLQCDIEEDTSTPCFVASLHTYPNAHNCELDIDGVHHGFSKASPSDFNLLEMAAGAKFYIFDDCQEHNNLVVTVKSS
ncbi:maternal protein tudor-like isoform X2 [Thrips palmi]|uniref:Maternal protein tudor-like isoform X2 n=1 Tax=Thrips palmi TaxID=161013 RepID=A0A6P8Y800_THRPL|nr:maternal protein tudor-like isoform X2 [Thrips palmi]